MKFSTPVASLAATLMAVSPAIVAAKDSRTFAVLRFNGKELTRARADPIVSPGKTASHVHSILGGSGFSLSSNGEDLKNSKCSNAKIKGDNSNYWYPAMYFKDPKTGELEDVEVFYTNAYYFFEATNDDIKAFPLGLSMVSGDAMTRSAPSTSETNLDPSKGEIQAVKYTCPRSNMDQPGWPPNSDGSTAGIGDPINKGEGVGFPDVECDGYASPLRADIHFPSCYNPDVGLTDFKNNMVFPSDAGNGKQDCPKGYIHVPHLFIEVYWNTPLFKDRWTQGQGDQPFVLSNGDVTGFSSHADFMAGWDEELLQHIIDTCDAGSSGMDNCPGLFYGLNEDECTIEPPVQEKTTGVLRSLPGNNPLSGWSYGTPEGGNGGGSDPAPVPSSSPKPTTSKADDTKPTSTEEGLPEETTPVTTIAGNPGVPTTKTSAETAPTEEPSQPEEPVEPAPTSAPAEPEVPTPTEPTSSECKRKTKTVWQTVTVTALPPTETGSSNSTDGAAGFQYAGCFKDAQDRVLSGAIRPNLGKVSNENCVSHCKEAGFSLAGTEHGGECYCGNELVGSEKIEEAECDMACEGDSAAKCGGGWALSVFSADGEASLKSSKVRRHAHEHAHEHLHLHRSHRF
jgi:hypothetical protein